MVTPYGGRIEYNIAGTPMVIHLKDSEKCQRGKRWSQVMYLYYLIGWKIDACSDMTGQASLIRYKVFISSDGEDENSGKTWENQDPELLLHSSYSF